MGVAEGPQVHSQSVMQMTCKSARVSRSLQFGSRPGALHSQSLAYTRVCAPICSLSRRAAPPPAPPRLGLASPAPQAAAGGRLSAEPALRARGQGAPAEHGASAPGPPSPRG